MTPLFSIDLSHINADAMIPLLHKPIFSSSPWQMLDLSSLQGLDIQTNLRQLSEENFYELVLGKIKNFNIIDVLALTVIQNNDWYDSELAKTVAENWWLSVLDKNNRKALQASLMLVLQYHNDSKSYQGLPSSEALGYLKQAFSSQNETLWSDNILRLSVQSILENRPSRLATLALDNEMTVNQLIKNYSLPVKTEFRKNASNEWLTLYLTLTEQQLSRYSKAIQNFLCQKNNIQFAVTQAELIFNNRYFKKDLSALEKQTHKFIDIHGWLKDWNKNSEFQKLLDNQYKSILRCWLGAGNYYQLEKAVRYIAQINLENIQQNRSISINRYMFWTNYQRYIIDYWLLIPASQQSKYYPIFATTNIKLINNKNHLRYFDSIVTRNLASVPTVLLKFDNYYFFQPLVNRAGGKDSADLIMTDNVQLLGNLLKSDNIDIHQFDKVEPCLIHDHMYLWQPDMASSLLEQFNITMKESFIRSNNKINHKERLNYIESWYNSSRFKELLGRYATSYQKRHKRHG